MKTTVFLHRGREFLRVQVPHCPFFDFDEENARVLAPFIAEGWRVGGHVDLLKEVS